MSAFTLRWCKEHGYWEDDVDSPTEACPTCIESGAFKTRAQLERELANCKRDLAAAEAKLAAKPDVARLVKEATTEALHQDARALTGADQSIAGALLRRLADALLSLSAQLAEKEAENVKLRGAVPCCQDFDNCTQRCFPRAEHFKAECEGLRQDAERWRQFRRILETEPWEGRKFLQYMNWLPDAFEQGVDHAFDSARKP